MPENDATTRDTDRPTPKKRRRRWPRLIIIVLGLVAILVGVLSYMTRPARLNRVLVELLEESIGCNATVGRAQMTWNGWLTIDGIDLTVPDAEGRMADLMHTDRVVVQLKMLPLLPGRVRAASVALSKPTLYLTEDLDHDRFNYELLLERPPGEAGDGGLPKALPELYLRGGEVRFGQITDGDYRLMQLQLLDGKLSADTKRPGGYSFSLTQVDESPEQVRTQGSTVRGEIDLNEPGIEVELDRFTFTGPYRYLMPEAARNWWSRLSPRGTIPRVVFSARLDEAQEVMLAAEMELDGIGLSLPADNDQNMELTEVTGKATLVEGLLSFTGVTGQIEGVGFTADGRLDNLERGGPFSVTLTTDPFDVPAEGGIWNKLPPSITKYRDRFSPQGRYQTKLTLSRAGPGEPLALGGHLDLLDTRFSYYRFPYPAETLTGRISFDNDRITLNDLQAIGPSGGSAVVSGSIGPPLRDGVVDITIRCTGMSVDEHLLAAMKPKHRKVMDLFFSQEGYEALLREGVIRAPADAPAREGQLAGANEAVDIDTDAPTFEPGGTTDVDIRIQRPAGQGQKYRVTTDLDATGIRAVFGFWHYPLVATSGRVIISPDEVLVRDVHVMALGGGGGIATGRLELPNEGRPLTPHLQLTSIHLPVDRMLAASIPPPKDQWVRSLDLRGVLVGTGEVFVDRHGEVAFTVDTQVSEGHGPAQRRGLHAERHHRRRHRRTQTRPASEPYRPARRRRDHAQRPGRLRRRRPGGGPFVSGQAARSGARVGRPASAG